MSHHNSTHFASTHFRSTHFGRVFGGRTVVAGGKTAPIPLEFDKQKPLAQTPVSNADVLLIALIYQIYWS